MNQSANPYSKQPVNNNSMMIVENQDEGKMTASQLQDKYKVINYDYNSSVSKTIQNIDKTRLPAKNVNFSI